MPAQILAMDSAQKDKPEKFLVIGPSWVGDMVMAQVLFRRLKANFDDCSISVLAPDWTRPLLERMPEVEDSIASTTQRGQLGLGARRTLGLSLREQEFTTAYVLPNSFKSALIPFHARIPRRIAWRGEFRGLLLTDSRVLKKDIYPLMVQRFAALAEPAGSKPPTEILDPRLSIDPETLSSTRNKFQLSIENRILAICPGAEFGTSKQWPAKHFASSCKSLIADGWRVWIFGSANDEAMAASILQEMNDAEQQACENLCGKTSLAEAIDLLSLTDVVISNDSGLMHIAAALDIPVVALYGSTSPDFTPPRAEKVKLLSTNIECRPCFKRECPLGHQKCLQDLEPELAISAVNELREEKQSRDLV
jgi:heptosyltransferase II